MKINQDKSIIKCKLKTSYLNSRSQACKLEHKSEANEAPKEIALPPSSSLKWLKSLKAISNDKLPQQSIDQSQSPKYKIVHKDTKVIQTSLLENNNDKIILPRSRNVIKGKFVSYRVQTHNSSHKSTSDRENIEKSKSVRHRIIFNINKTNFDSSIIPDTSDQSLRLNEMIKYYHYRSKLLKPFK